MPIKRLHSSLVLVICLFINIFSAQSQDYTRFVNPFIGTAGNGHTFPGATMPFGMMQLSPQTGNYSWDYVCGYQYNDTIIEGFGHSYVSGAGVGRGGYILVFPFTHATNDFKSVFSKTTEKAAPGYYAVLLKKDTIKAEFTTTQRVGIHSYTFNKGTQAHILLNIDNSLISWGKPNVSWVSEANYVIENDSVITGHITSTFWLKRDVYFAIKLNSAFVSYYFLDAQKRKLVLDYNLKNSKKVEVRVALSTVSMEGAKNNLEKETTGKSFEMIRQNAQKEWNKHLSLVTIKGDKNQKINFYTSLYHLFIQPNNITDIDGRYSGADGAVHFSKNKAYYSTFALWDTYRAAHPLYSILIPEKNTDFVLTMLDHFDAKGELPIWTLWGNDGYNMVGHHSVPVIVDACLKGMKGIDGNRAMDAIKQTLTVNKKGLYSKYDWSVYNKFGYIPSDKTNAEAVSKTMEAAYDDWCAAQLAKVLGRIDDYNFFIKRSAFYKNVFDTTVYLVRGRLSDSTWVKPFNPLKLCHAGTSNGDFTEANAWQYTWQVQHDITGLMTLMGGQNAFANKLDKLFSLPSTKEGDGNTNDVSGLIGQYAHGNEPCHHVIYLYNYAGKPYKAQELISKVLETQYQNKPDGLSGNDDNGQMSAWFIFSSLGFYPVNPASGIFDIGLPSYKYASMKVRDKSFIIEAPNLSKTNKYVQSVLLNGKLILDYKISYKDIMQGGVLKFTMGSHQ